MAEWQHPFSPKTVTSHFGAVKGRLTPHRGTDYAPGVGKVIRAVTDGVVAQIKWSNVLGWMLVQKTTDGWYVGYNHLFCVHHGADCEGPQVSGCKSPFISLKVGSPLVMNVTSVGRVGNSGSASKGAHLHITLGKKITSNVSGVAYNFYKHVEKLLAA